MDADPAGNSCISTLLLLVFFTLMNDENYIKNKHIYSICIHLGDWHFQFIASIILFKMDSKIISFKWILVKIRNVNRLVGNDFRIDAVSL